MELAERKLETISWELVDEKALKAPATSLLQEAQELVIDCDAMYQVAAEQLGYVKAGLKELVDFRMSITRPIDEGKRRVMERFAPSIAIREQTEAVYKDKMAEWIKKQAEAERIQRLEAARVAALEQAKADAVAKLAADEAARLAAEATATNDTAVAQKAQEAAAAAQEAAETALMPVVPVYQAPMKPKAAGTSHRETLVVVIDDPVVLLNFIADNRLLHLVEIKQGALNTLANAQKAAFKMPGVHLETKTIIGSRAR
jgi:hypothetical protein